MRYLSVISIVLFIPFSVFANVVINEIAWMGIDGANGQYGEWIEFYNLSDQEINLAGWKLYRKGGLLESDRIFTLTKSIQPNGYLIIERTTSSIPDPLPNINDEIGAFGGGNLANLPGGEFLVLKDNNENIIQSLDFSNGWSAGNNTAPKQTMQKTSAGNWITAQATPRAKNQETGTANQSSSNDSQSQNSQAQIVESDQSKQIKVEAGEDKIVFVGQKNLFQGKVFGLNNEEIKNARFLWNFGDGAINEGSPISHIYRYFGEYIVILNASSGIYANNDQLRVKVSASPIKITGLKPGENGFVEISNQSNYEIDISGFSFSDGKKYFYFPENSIIPAGSRTFVSGNISGINFASPSSAKFYYPDGSLIQEFKYESERIADKNIIAESPKISAPIVKNIEIKNITKNKEEDILASSATIQNENKEKQRSIYFWIAIVFGIASFSGIISFFFIKSGENDKIPQK